MSKIEWGREYDVVHGRKGHFRIRVDKVKGDIVTGTIVEGNATYVSEDTRVPGDKINLDTSRSFITLVPVGS